MQIPLFSQQKGTYVWGMVSFDWSVANIFSMNLNKIGYIMICWGIKNLGEWKIIIIGENDKTSGLASNRHCGIPKLCSSFRWDPLYSNVGMLIKYVKQIWVINNSENLQNQRNRFENWILMQCMFKGWDSMERETNLMFWFNLKVRRWEE